MRMLRCIACVLCFHLDRYPSLCAGVYRCHIRPRWRQGPQEAILHRLIGWDSFKFQSLDPFVVRERDCERKNISTTASKSQLRSWQRSWSWNADTAMRLVLLLLVGSVGACLGQNSATGPRQLSWAEHCAQLPAGPAQSSCSTYANAVTIDMRLCAARNWTYAEKSSCKCWN